MVDVLGDDRDEALLGRCEGEAVPSGGGYEAGLARHGEQRPRPDPEVCDSTLN